MFDWLIAAVLLAILVYLIAPQQLPVSLYKLSLVALAAVAGYWIDRSVFPYARPHFFVDATALNLPKGVEVGDALWSPPVVDGSMPSLAASCMLRRAIIISAAMIAVSLGA